MSKILRRYRRENLAKAAKPFTPVFEIEVDLVMADLVIDKP